MAGQQYGWHDSVGGVEPGFADPRILMQMRPGHGPAEDVDDRPVCGTDARKACGERDDAWLRHLLD